MQVMVALRQSLLQCIRLLIFQWLVDLDEVRGKTSAKQMIMRWKRGRLCLKNPTNRRKMFCLTGLRFILSLSQSCLPLLAPLPPQAQQGLSLHPSSLSGPSGSLINRQAALFTSVTLSAPLRERKDLQHTGAVIHKIIDSRHGL